ncbi:hypothetical protein [Pseudomonas brenneri]
MASWFSEGTVSVQNGSPTVTGVGTKFSNCRSGDMFVGPDQGIYQVINPASDTSLAISPPYRGPAVGGAGYGIVPVNGYPKALADAVNQMVQQWGATLAGLGPLASAEIAPVANGGTGASTAEGARTNLGLGTAATANAGTAPGNVIPVGGGGWLGVGAFLANLGGSYQSCVLGGGPATPGGSDVVLNLPWPGDPGWKAQLFMKVSENKLFYRSIRHNSSGGLIGDTPAVELYHTGNTTRAQDGTIKAI